MALFARVGLVLALIVSLLSGSVTGLTGVAQAATDSNPQFELTRSDLNFILKQIKISETHAEAEITNDPDYSLLCADPTDTSGTCVPDPRLPWGLRTVDGSFNNLVEGQENYGAADQPFPRLLDPLFQQGEPAMAGGPPNPPGTDAACAAPGSGATCYAQTGGFVYDSEPRVISNLIVDQTDKNPAAVSTLRSTDNSTMSRDGRIFIPNESPDEGLSAPYTSWMTLFGQFFDHGLDMVNKGGSGTVVTPLKPDDPLWNETPPNQRFLTLTRATNKPGPNGVLGDGDDIRDHNNQTTPFVDQNQTYTSHPSHQVFLREYVATEIGPVPTGKLLDGVNPDGTRGGIATWAQIKTQARDLLGIDLIDSDVMNVPMVATDPYGRFVPAANGLPQLVTDEGFVPGDLANPEATSQAVRSNHAFLDDIAHHAVPGTFDHDHNPATPRLPLAPDSDTDLTDDHNPATYDDEMLESHFITGDGRGNENIGLTSVHHVFHSEHNRLVNHVDNLINDSGDQAFIDAWQDDSGIWDYGERLFQASRYATEMQYQHLVFEEFARKVQPAIDPAPLNESTYHSDINPAIAAEYAHTVYRFGHSMLTETMARDGWETKDLSLLNAFLNPAEFTDNGRLTADQGAGAVINGMTKQRGNAIDEFVTNTLRNKLLGLPLDLATINIMRARDTGVPGLQAARQTFYDETGDASMRPYDNWADFQVFLKNRPSIVNFVAAYGNDPLVENAQTVNAKRAAAKQLVNTPAFMNRPAAQSGLNDVDFWIGGLAERAEPFGGMLGTTFNFVFEEQMQDLQNGDRFYYLNRNIGLNLFHALEANSFAQLILRNTDATRVPAEIFSGQDCVFDLANPTGLTQMEDGTWRFDGGEHVTIHGTPNNDRMSGAIGDDFLWGYDGNDRIEGDAGNDSFLGGDGDDILTDRFGDDNLKGGRGNDYIEAGPGFDVVLSGPGKDFINLGEEGEISFSGSDDDFIKGGASKDVVRGDEGDDWMEGLGGADLMQGDNANGFQNDPDGGADVIIGGSGNDDHDSEGGDDIMVTSPGGDRHEGMLGFDWVTHKGDTQGGNADLEMTALTPPDVQNLGARYDLVEGLSGWNLDDVLRGTGLVDPADGPGHNLTQEGIDRITGLGEMLGEHAGTYMSSNPSGDQNDIILGGGGSDLFEGRGGDDFIDGDAWLNVALEWVDPTGAAVPERADSMQPFQARIKNGIINPGDISIVREILQGDAAPDTAIFSDEEANYDVATSGDTVIVTHLEDEGDGTDVLRNIEQLQFADSIVGSPVTVTISDTTPVEGQELTATLNGIAGASPTFQWQLQDPVVEGTWNPVSTGATFIPSADQVGSALQVVATYLDDTNTQVQVTSEPTEAVSDDPAIVALAIETVTTSSAAQSLSAPQLFTLAAAAAASCGDPGDIRAPRIKLKVPFKRFNLKKKSFLPVRYGLNEASRVKVTVQKGRKVMKVLADVSMSRAVTKHLRWNGRNRLARVVQPGQYRIVVVAVDAAGNKATRSAGVRVIR